MSRLLASVVVISALLLTGCEKKADPNAHPEDTASGDAYAPLDSTGSGGTTPTYTTPSNTGGSTYNTTPSTYTPPADTSYTATPSYTAATATEPLPPPSNSDELLAPESGGGATYVVKRGDTLSKISRAQYGTDKRWRDIYKANKARIANPNKLKIGTKLIIP